MIIDEVTRRICDIEGVGINDILSPSRLQNLCRCRVLIWCVLRSMGISIKQFCPYFNRNHSTVAKLTSVAPQAVKDEAVQYVVGFGKKPMKWLEPFRRGTRVTRYPLRIIPAPKPPKPPKPKVYRKVPDYQNYCVKIVEVA